MLAPDLMHEFELGVWRGVFQHLIRLLASQGGGKLQTFYERYVYISSRNCWSFAEKLQYAEDADIRARHHSSFLAECLATEQTCSTRLGRLLAGEPYTQMNVLAHSSINIRKNWVVYGALCGQCSRGSPVDNPQLSS